MLQRIKFGLDVDGRDLVIELEEKIHLSVDGFLDQYWIGYVVDGNKIVGFNDNVKDMHVLNMIEEISIEIAAHEDHHYKLMGDI